MNNILETNLHLTHAPISIKDFNRIKKAPVLDPELWNEKESLDNASLYIIGKREVPVFVPRREMSDESCLILDAEVGKTSFRIFIPASTNSNLPKYISNFPYFTGFPACALAKRYVFSLIFALMR